MNKNNRYTILNTAIILLVSLIIMARQIVSQGYFSANVNDTFAYTSWAWQFVEELKGGIIYPRWMSHDFYGYGGPVFILYPPLAFYITAFFNIFTESIVAAMNLTKLLALFLSSLGMFLFVKQILTEKYALAAALFYLIMPFTVMQFYLLGSFASTISFIWFPYILLFIYKYFEHNENKYIVYTSICYAGLICTHLINTYMFTYVMVVYVLVLSMINNKKSYVKILPAVLATAVLLSGAYSFPLMFEKKYLNLSAFIANGNYNFGDYKNFFILPDMSHNLPPGHSWTIYYETYALITILFCTIITFVVLHVFNKENYNKSKEVFCISMMFICLAVISILLQFYPSKILWENLPYFKYIQFPSRWMILTNFICAILIAVFFYFFTFRKKNYYVCILTVAFMLIDYKYIAVANVFKENVLFPVKDNNCTIEHLPSGADLNQIRNSNKQINKVEIKNGSGKLRIIDWKPSERIFSFEAGQPSTLRVSTFNFPGWTAYMDGRITQISAEESTKAIIMDIPPGEHLIKLIFEDTAIRLYGKIISVATLLLMFLLLLFKNIFLRKVEK